MFDFTKEELEILARSNPDELIRLTLLQQNLLKESMNALEQAVETLKKVKEAL
jgi:hypothetical protein